jgi:hypothetical protein
VALFYSFYWLHILQPAGQPSVVEAAQVPLPHTHEPGLQHAAVWPLEAQQWFGLQHTPVLVLPQQLLGAVQLFASHPGGFCCAAALTRCPAAAARTAPASMLPRCRSALRRGMGVARIREMSSNRLSIGFPCPIESESPLPLGKNRARIR